MFPQFSLPREFRLTVVAGERFSAVLFHVAFETCFEMKLFQAYGALERFVSAWRMKI